MTLAVRDYELDAEGIVNNAVYLNYFEHTRHEFCRQVGVSFDDMLSRGIVPVVRRVEVDYHVPLRGGNTVVSSLTVSRRGARFVFNQVITLLPSLLTAATAEVTVVAVADGRVTRGDALAEVFKDYLA